MSRTAIVQILSNPSLPDLKLDYASTFLEKFSGLMFRKIIRENEGLILSDQSESRINTAIHMFFMNFDIGVIWIDSSLTVVDKKYAKRWHPFYIPRRAAQYTVELHPSMLKHFSIGDQIALSIES